jgi:hypothetical protein
MDPNRTSGKIWPAGDAAFDLQVPLAREGSKIFHDFSYISSFFDMLSVSTQLYFDMDC